jgi:DNA-binding NtrC family response regulator
MIMQARVLVVDDEPDMLSTCRKFLEREGYDVAVAENGRDGVEQVSSFRPDLVITDLKMPGLDGMEVLRRTKEDHPDTMVMMFTGFGTIEDAVEAMKEGAFDFITKPFSPDHLLIAVQRALRQKRLELENRSLQDQLEEKFRFENIIGRSAAMNRVFDLVKRIAATDANVLITGESGTGKELIARSVHANSKRPKGPFVPLNCGGLPEHLVESELFGHEKGAFTGANAVRPGLMEHANGGTFFLDEIGELPMNLQVKFLRVLEERNIRRVGSNRERDIDIRLISATNQECEALIEEGKFREDLYYRINTFVIRVPSLRERTEDIPLLTAHFLKTYCPDGRVTGLTEEATQMLTRHSWPGNVRELQHVVERGVALASGSEIDVADLPENLGQMSKRSGGNRLAVDRLHLPFKDAKESIVEDFERNYIEHLLSNHSGNISRAAEASGIDRRSLHRLLVKHEIDASSFSTR